MNRAEIEDKVREFLIEDLEVEEDVIAPEAKLKDDLGIDSLDFVDIVVIVERKFGFKIKPEEMAGGDDAEGVLRLYREQGGGQMIGPTR